MESLNEETYMGMALQIAKETVGQTGINPTVGCVIVKNGRIVGIGAHLQRGSHHAEVHALHMAAAEAKGSTVYVTLEPCSHYGSTPPCTEKLIAAGVKKVVIAAMDPNPQVAGNGIRTLRAAGVEVQVGVMEEEATRLNEMFHHYIVHRTPFVTVKAASTLDGKIAAASGDSRWVTGPEARTYAHVLRHRHEAIMVGVNTVIHDDPSLTTRLSVEALQPTRIIVDSHLRVPENSKVASDGLAPTWVLCTAQAPQTKKERLRERGVHIIECGAGPQVDLRLALQRLGEQHVASILVEGGGKLNGALLAERLVHKIVLFFAPKIIGGTEAPGSFHFTGFDKMDKAIRLRAVDMQPFGDDFCLSGYPDYEGADANVHRHH